jgi:hypothetical protein
VTLTILVALIAQKLRRAMMKPPFDHDFSDKVMRVLFLIGLIVVALDVLIWRP